MHPCASLCERSLLAVLLLLPTFYRRILSTGKSTHIVSFKLRNEVTSACFILTPRSAVLYTAPHVCLLSEVLAHPIGNTGPTACIEMPRTSERSVTTLEPWKGRTRPTVGHRQSHGVENAELPSTWKEDSTSQTPHRRALAQRGCTSAPPPGLTRPPSAGRGRYSRVAL